MSLLLIDTCAVILLSSDAKIDQEAELALDEAWDREGTLFMSPITAWEVGMLVSKDRLKILFTPERWLADFMRRSGARWAEMPPAVLLGSNFLPGRPPKDPADRIIAATARELGATLITRDRLLLAYGAQGHIRAIAC